MPALPPAVDPNTWPRRYPPLVPAGPLAGPFGSSTEPFWILYGHVTGAIRETIRGDRFDAQQRMYVEYLVAGFFQEYARWTQTRWSSRYLGHFERRAPFRALHLTGQAYLHIAYDLPRVIADFDMPLSADLDQAYLALQPALERALKRCAHDRRAFGPFAWLSYLPGKDHLYGTLLFWVIALRTVALAHGRLLHGATLAERRRHERDLRRAVRRAARHALEHAYLPVGWLAAFQPPVLLAALFPITFAIRIEWWHPGVLAVLAAVLSLTRTVALRRHVTQFANIFGQELSRRLNELLLESAA